MNKFLTSFVLVAVLAAVAVPAAAVAENDATLLEVSNGVHGAPLPAGTKLLARGNHSAFTRMTDASGNTLISCTTNEVTGELTKNTHTAVEGNITSATFKGKTAVTPHTAECTGGTGDILANPNPATNGLPWCLQIRSVDATDTARLRGGKCSEAVRPIRFEFTTTTIFGSVVCIFQRTEPITGTYTTGTNPVAKLTGGEFTRQAGSSGICPEKVFFDVEGQLLRDPSGEIALVNAT